MPSVVPAKAGTQRRAIPPPTWIPACAGMTEFSTLSIQGSTRLPSLHHRGTWLELQLHAPYTPVVPAKAGTQRRTVSASAWIPA